MNLVERLRSRCKDLGERYHRSPDEVEPDLWKAADEIDRLQVLHLERTKSTHKALVERDEEIEKLRAALEKTDEWESRALASEHNFGLQVDITNELQKKLDDVLHQKPE